MVEKITIIGGGVMGSALAIHLGRKGHEVNIWGTQWDDEIIKEMKETRRHSILQEDLADSISLFYHGELEEALKDRKLIILAVISKGMEDMSKKLSPYLNKNHLIASVTKGIDEDSLRTMSAIIKDSLPEDLKNIGIVKLGGPLIAKEVAQGKYSEGIFASANIEAAQYVAGLFSTNKFKVSISTDIDGVDLCAAFKNPYAIAMGIIEAVEREANNSKAAFMARGAVEMGNIVEAYGGSRETALGLAGIGDYYVTGQGGRNGIFGRLIGEGKSKEEALEAMNHQTVEGLANSLNGYKLLKKLEAEGKIDLEKDTSLFLQIYKILYEAKPVKEAIADYWKNS